MFKSMSWICMAEPQTIEDTTMYCIYDMYESLACIFSL